MAEQVARAPLGQFERTLVDVFCKVSPCAAARWYNARFSKGSGSKGNDDSLYEACRRVAHCTSMCPLGPSGAKAA